jgi:hypothetical protein
MTVIDLERVARTYAKASKENIDNIAAPFQADPQKIELLFILDEQVKLLAQEGQPDPSRLFDSLKTDSIIPSEEVSSLRTEYGLERVSRYLVWVLDTYTNATCLNNRNRYYKATWILPLAKSSKRSATFSASTRSMMTILL